MVLRKLSYSQRLILMFSMLNVLSYFPSYSKYIVIGLATLLLFQYICGIIVFNYLNIERGNILVFYSDELKETLIKRVIGLPGDHIVIHDGIININGNDIKENYVKNNMEYSGIFDVPENEFFFLGDNRSNSRDSRLWTDPYINKNHIKGKAIFRFYPFDSMGYLNSN